MPYFSAPTVLVKKRFSIQELETYNVSAYNTRCCHKRELTSGRESIFELNNLRFCCVALHRKCIEQSLRRMIFPDPTYLDSVFYNSTALKPRFIVIMKISIYENIPDT